MGCAPGSRGPLSSRKSGSCRSCRRCKPSSPPPGDITACSRPPRCRAMRDSPDMAQHPVLAGLTSQQAIAAQQSGAVLVLAGAGTGKTKTLTAAIGHRIAVRGVAPARILAVTFTNKAAAEMVGRIRAMLVGRGRRTGSAPSTASARASCASSRRSPGCGRVRISSTPTTAAAWSSAS